MKKKLTALFTTGIMLLSAAPAPMEAAADKTAYDSVIGTLPDWTPMDFISAMKLYNEHGKCFVSDGYICMVRPVRSNRKDDIEFSISGGASEINSPVCEGTKYYELDIPENPDPEDLEASMAFEEYCDSLGLSSHNYSFFENYAENESRYVFEVDMFRVPDGLDMTVTWHEKNGDKYEVTEVFTFENHDGTTVETDMYRWLPDCVPEYNSFVNEYGIISVHDNYVAYWADINYTVGASLKMEQSGEGAIEEFLESDCSPFVLDPGTGRATPSVIIYKPAADGMADVTWRIGRSFSDTEPKVSSEGKFEIKNNCTEIIDWSANRKTSAVFTFIDADTEEPVDVSGKGAELTKSSRQAPYTSDMYYISSNPCTITLNNAYDPNCSYSFSMDSQAGRYDVEDMKVTAEEADRREVNVFMKWCPNGDLNGSGEFNIADLVSLQNWLKGDADTELPNWLSADFCHDNVIDVFDMIVMRRKLIEKLGIVVSPEYPSSRYTLLRITGEDHNLYAGPGTEYMVLDTIDGSTLLHELGFSEGVDDWVFTEANGKQGWVRVNCDGKPNVIFMSPAIDKPVIYLYPEEETDVHVELTLTESELSTTYPRYNNGWDVTAYPDGRLLNKADGTHHRYLFWDSVNSRTRFDLSKGFCVAGSDTESFLREKLTYMGLTEDEMNEFIVYWLPRMEHNRYNLISFQGKAYTDSARLDITPSPDSICRIFMTYIPLENAVDIQPQQLETFERKGFTVVEWGGSQLS